MATRNTNLHTAVTNKRDEFYTQLSDIENELKYYRPHFKDKIVLCNCDDPRVSNFFKYFALNFELLGLKRLIATCYKNNEPDLFSQHTAEQAVYIVYEGDKNGNRVPDPSEMDVLPLKGDGDFRSPECIELLEQADIVCTNPPFSLFREYVAQLIHYQKKFLILGNKNAITYKEIFPLIASNQIWVGMTPMSREVYFDVPQSYIEDALAKNKDRSVIKVGGKYVARSPSIWYTNLDNKKRHEELVLYKTYNPEDYPKYDNYDAIDVSKVSDIPIDYEGVMGVPITFLDKYCPEQFEIVEFRKGKDGKDLVFSIRQTRTKLLHRTSGYSSGDADRRTDEQPEGYDCEREKPLCEDTHSSTSIPGMIKNAEGKINGKITYARVLIRQLTQQ